MFNSLKRLKCVRDISLLPGHWFAPHEATPWYPAIFINPKHTFITDRSMTVRVISNRVLAWNRSYTRDGLPPPVFKSHAWFQIDEWAPWHQPKSEDLVGTWRSKRPFCGSVSWLDEGDHLRHWSEQARRHLKVFKKASGITLRLGTLQEILPAYAQSQVPADMRHFVVGETQRHLAAHPDSVDILVAEHVERGIIGAFVALHNDAAKQSLYALGFFLPEASRMQPMVGLVDWWFRRCKERGLRAAHFGMMVRPNVLPFDNGIGYSNFKTHFGCTRIWFPDIVWRFSRNRKTE